MKIIAEHLVVKVPSIFLDESQYIGVDGMQIMINVMYRPERHIRDFGIVTEVPEYLHDVPLLNDSIGLPGYHDYAPYSWKTNNDIVMNVNIGDKVYFHYNTLLPDVNGGTIFNKYYLFSKKEEENGKLVLYHYYRVKYDQVFAVVRYERANNATKSFEWWMEKKITPFKANIEKVQYPLFMLTDQLGQDHVYRKKVITIGSYVLIEPDLETWEDISLPTPATMNGKQLLNPDGSIVMKPKDQWLVVKSMPGEKYLRGWVRFCSSPLKGDKEFLREGMYVYFQRFANTKIQFEGHDYFRMRQRHIIAVDDSKYQDSRLNNSLANRRIIYATP